MNELEEAQAAYDAAQIADRAARKVAQDTGEAVRVAMLALRKAKSNVAPAHAWEGRTVTRKDTVWSGSGFYRANPKTVTLRGIVQTYRVGVEVGRGMYGLKIGDPVVQLLKADGSPGKRYALFGDSWALETPTVSK